MLTNTYIHIPNIGTTTERRIWDCGIKCWEDYVENHNMIKLPRTKKRLLLSGVEESIEQLSSGNHKYFARRLPMNMQWRAYRHFKEKTAYVDIETTGLSCQNDRITMIGIYNGNETKTFVRGIDLDKAPAELGKYKQIITFNGARFDLPFIEYEFPGTFDQIHIDLMYPLKKIGYSGGLKKIESMLGLRRSDETAGITGLDAVRLWKRYERGNSEALETLIKYNTEDVVNLEKIIRITHPWMIERELKVSKKS
ncbi:RNase_H superfamily protein [uncultured archaeon]|nr:RNase_H superfamily protein [uncultured archaeon]